MNKQNDINLKITRNLLDKYFEATISPDEAKRLAQTAKNVASGRMTCAEQGVRDDLLLINTLNSFAESSINYLQNSVPDGLEDRLNSHISHLAADSSSKIKRPVLPRIFATAAAAAVIMLLAYSGIKYISTDRNHKPTTAMIAETTIPKEDSTTSREAASPHIVEAKSPQLADNIASANAVMPSGSSSGSVKKIQKTTANRNVNSHAVFDKREKEIILKTEDALSSIPPITQDVITISEDAFKVMPTGLTAYIETSQVLMQPLTTLSQSINNVYESVRVVSEALSGVPVALDAVNSSLSLLSNSVQPI